MTREESIRKLKRELEAIEGDWRFKELAEALDMAIQALQDVEDGKHIEPDEELKSMTMVYMLMV